MFNRAVRDWLPLVTTNIRLRNLIKITAVNLHCVENNNDGDKKQFVYFTLHLSAFSKPFYTSSCVEIRNGKANWPEINCEQCRESSQKFICIRIWQKSSSSTSITSPSSQSSSGDKVLFLWGIYFSGLVLIPSTTSSSIRILSNYSNGGGGGGDVISFKENTILFQLDGGIFTSSEQIIYHNKPDNNNSIIIPSKTAVTTKTIEEEAELNCDKNNHHQHHYLSKYSTNNINRISPSSTPPQKLLSYEIEGDHSSANGEEQVEEDGAFNAMDILSNYPKVRYIQLKFPKNEIQPSYKVERLLQLQEIQREIFDRKKESRVIAERICMKSPACLNLELVNSTAKPIFYEPQKQPGMGRTLSRLLAQAPPKPEELLKSHELRKKIEGARFRIKLLLQERDRCRQNNKQLELKREKLKDDNTETETRIWNSLRTLNRENLRAYEEKLALQRETFMNVKLALLETRRNLLRDLNEIYEVKKCDRFYTINGIHLPDAESFGDTQSSAVEISIALGYVAHCVLIISRILNVPLRNPINHEGSRSKIMDIIKILPPTDRM